MKMKRYFLGIEKGQGLVEYALILVGVAIVGILALELFGTTLNDVYCSAVGDFMGGGESCIQSQAETPVGEDEETPTPDEEEQLQCSASFDDLSELADWEASKTGKDLVFTNGKACSTNGNVAFFNSCTVAMGNSDIVANLNGITIEKKGKSNSGFDFYFRSQDSDNGYKFIYDAKRSTITFAKLYKGKTIVLESGKAPSSWKTEEVNLQIQVSGNTFTAISNGVGILQTVDDAYSEGKIGFSAQSSSNVCIDEISVQQMP